MNSGIERNLGAQPIAEIMAKYCMRPRDLVIASGEQLTHKMVSRAVKGRRLTRKARLKVLNALNKAAGKNYSLSDLFNYH